MGEKRVVKCPQCRTKLAYDPEKLKSAVTKFSCPKCKVVLGIRKTAAGTGTAPVPAVGISESGTVTGMDEAAGGERMAGAVEQGLPAAGKNGGKPPASEDDGRAERTNLRETKRTRFKKKVLVNNQIMVEALDISPKGLFLHTGRSFEDGAIVEVGIPTRPGNFDLKVQATVRHNHRGIGMGLMFVDLDANTVMQLEKLVIELDEAAAKELEGRKKILLAGGTETFRNINKSKLVLDGFYVLQATTADEIFAILDREAVDAIVLEWQDAGYNGKEVLAKITATPAWEQVVRVVLAVLTDSEVQREISAAGGHSCMAKMNANPAKLSQELSRLLAARDS